MSADPSNMKGRIALLQIKEPQVVHHRSARSICASFSRGMGVRRPEDLFVGPDFSIVQATRGMRMWAFYDFKKNVVHWWAHPKADANHVLWMVAHEFGHAADRMVRKRFSKSIGSHEEHRADFYGWATLRACQALLRRGGR
jgi:hypothetical protein